MGSMPGTTGLVYADLRAFPDDGIRRELLDGELLVTPSPNLRHQTLVGRLGYAIEHHLRAHGSGRLLHGPFDVVLAKDVVFEPDLLFVGDDRAQHLTDANLQGPPTIAIEVLSDAHRDRILKRDAYARFGVPEYWIVDPESDWVEIYRPGRTGYAGPQILRPPARLTSTQLPGLEIDLVELFEPAR